MSLENITSTFNFKCGCKVDVIERVGRQPLFVLQGQSEGLTPAPWGYHGQHWLYCARMVLQEYCLHVDVPYDEKRELIDDELHVQT